MLLEAARAQREYLSEETLALAARIGDEDGGAPAAAAYSETATIEGMGLEIGLRRVESA